MQRRRAGSAPENTGDVQERVPGRLLDQHVVITPGWSRVGARALLRISVTVTAALSNCSARGLAATQALPDEIVKPSCPDGGRWARSTNTDQLRDASQRGGC